MGVGRTKPGPSLTPSAYFCLLHAIIHNFNTISTRWYKECLGKYSWTRADQPCRRARPYHKFDSSAPNDRRETLPHYTSFSSILNFSHFSNNFLLFSLCARRDNSPISLITDITTTTFTYLGFSPCILRQPCSSRRASLGNFSVPSFSLFSCALVLSKIL